jgi:capsular exopolysaccharide synthesis family protein
MTRLFEALERARTLTDGEVAGNVLPPDSNGSSVPDMPRSWRFDRGAAAHAQAEAAPAPVLEVVQARAADLVDEGSGAQPAYAFLNDWTNDKLIVGPDVSTAFVEQYRRLAASLHHAQLQSGARTVMIASAVESEGKTLTAANVALTLSHSYKRNVLLVDADLRRPSQHQLFQLSNREGLGETLIGRTLEGRLPVQRVSPNLWVMTAGRPNSDPMSGLVSDTMRQFLHEATEQFDWVVIDTPPVALLTDANLLASMIDVALLVVSAKTTPYPLVRRAVEAIGAERVLGVVLNRSDGADTVPGYYYSYAYSYGASRPSDRRWWQFKLGRGRSA